jgi:hypothetical protein
VRKDVVHLSGDPGALKQPRLGDPVGLLGLDPAGSFSQGRDERGASLGQCAPADQRSEHGDIEQQPPAIGKPGVRPPRALDGEADYPGPGNR